MNKIYCEDCTETLKRMDDESIQCVITSPPYWGLRDYGINGQLGLEKTPEEYVEKLVAIFREIRRVLKKDGTVWINLGDSYAGQHVRYEGKEKKWQHGVSKSRPTEKPLGWYAGIKAKQLIGIPWRVAFALQADGWYLRSDIIWSKPNPMPESVKDRPTKAHEYIFLLSKSKSYYYDQDAIKEESKTLPHKPGWVSNVHDRNDRQLDNESNQRTWGNGRSNKRSVWTVATQPYPEAHFATFPEDLIKPCVLAGCPEWICKKCGKARERIVEPTEEYKKYLGKGHNDHSMDKEAGLCQPKRKNFKSINSEYKTTGFSDCGCNAGWEAGTIYDPFMGAGTTALVALQYQRKFIGSELNPEYVKIAERRIKPLLMQTNINYYDCNI